jgi:hypothetical protein
MSVVPAIVFINYENSHDTKTKSFSLASTSVRCPYSVFYGVLIGNPKRWDNSSTVPNMYQLLAGYVTAIAVEQTACDSTLLYAT